MKIPAVSCVSFVLIKTLKVSCGQLREIKPCAAVRRLQVEIFYKDVSMGMLLAGRARSSVEQDGRTMKVDQPWVVSILFSIIPIQPQYIP